MIKNMLKTIHNPNGQLAISFILGIGLARLFRKVCKDRKCIVFRAPDLDEVTKNTYMHNNKCYSFTKSAVSCGQSANEIEI